MCRAGRLSRSHPRHGRPRPPIPVHANILHACRKHTLGAQFVNKTIELVLLVIRKISCLLPVDPGSFCSLGAADFRKRLSQSPALP